LVDKLKNLKKAQEAENFWQDQVYAQNVSKQIRVIENKLTSVENLKHGALDLAVLIDLCESEQDDSLLPEIVDEFSKLENQLDAVWLQTLLNGKYDLNNAIMTLHAGAGGTEAQDWTEMLYRMYTRYAERKGYTLSLMDIIYGQDAGIKSVTFMVSGEYAYGYLKAEKGVHRLVRISPFDSGGSRHTSFSSAEVMPEITENSQIDIKPEDLRIDTYHSGGAGGQNVNKTDSAVRITHLPTKIVVQCQNERSQLQNKALAMCMLISKLTELKEREEQEKLSKIQGQLKKIEWGSQIRSYVFCPYTMVKDHRTNYETGNVQAVMDGDLENFIVEYLKKSV